MIIILHTRSSCNLLDDLIANDMVTNFVEINVMWQNQQSH
eukprot:CAMPEP_0194114614 /NCGR_PEP_ID=MMETSP0150-20130528/20846_1 /TAXON_ID=122233 /ORGANISM="Chaetoceros debilis, Strain MM31A-1" /LENGTH=39 /DNA_ID= /DNA_START= /DNA_END= /DNA_ORIENTATION=